MMSEALTQPVIAAMSDITQATGAPVARAPTARRLVERIPMHSLTTSEAIGGRSDNQRVGDHQPKLDLTHNSLNL